MVGTNLAEHQGVLWSGTAMRVRDAYARARGSHADCARGGVLMQRRILGMKAASPRQGKIKLTSGAMGTEESLCR